MKYIIAIYLRLSVDDKRIESMSIESQRLLLRKYAEKLADDVEIIEYVDKVCETEDDKDYKKLCSQIDLFVAKLYNLSMDDYRLITTVLNE